MFKMMMILVLAGSLLSADRPDTGFLEKMALERLQKSDEASYKAYQTNLKAQTEARKDELRAHIAIIYLTSSSVPGEHFIKIADEAASVGIEDIRVYPLVRGIDKGLKGLVFGFQGELKDLTPGHREQVLKIGAPLRVSPALFTALDVKQVPAIAIGVCQGRKVSMKECDIRVLARGMTTLGRMAQEYGVGDSADELIKAVTR